MDKSLVRTTSGTVLNTYVFSDWYSVNQIPNTFDPKRRAYVSGIYDNGVFKGYELTVVKGFLPVDSLNPTILYRVHVEDTTEGTYSLTYNQAVQLLNDIGFICKYEPKIKTSSKVISILKNLEGLGFTHVVKVSEDCNIYAWCEGKEPQLKCDLASLADFNYHDWDFIADDKPKLISGLLKILEEETPDTPREDDGAGDSSGESSGDSGVDSGSVELEED